MQRPAFLIAAFLTAIVAAWPAGAVEEAAPPPCFDVAVVARLVRQTPTALESRPDEIVMRWPWLMDFDVQQVVVGPDLPDHMRVVMSLHTGIYTTIDRLLFLKRSEKWGFVVIQSVGVVEDFRGRLVVPLAGPMEDFYLPPMGLMPADYARMLKPIRYDPRDGWWLTTYVYPEDPPPPGPEWRETRQNLVVAKRGLFVDDLAPLLKPRQCPRPS